MYEFPSIADSGQQNTSEALNRSVQACTFFWMAKRYCSWVWQCWSNYSKCIYTNFTLQFKWNLFILCSFCHDKYEW